MRKMFRFLFWVALIVGSVIGVARATAIRWWRVPQDAPFLTASISPSVHAGDLVLLWRLTKPRFGSLVLCPDPKSPGYLVIGRIVGEAKDEVEITGADITVNGKRQQVESNCAERTFIEHDPSTGAEVTQSCSIEDLGGGTSLRGELAQGAAHPVEVKTTVPAATFWLASDNRQFPYDSRDFGPVPRATCTETIFFRLVSKGGFFDADNRNQYIR